MSKVKFLIALVQQFLLIYNIRFIIGLISKANAIFAIVPGADDTGGI